MEKLPAEVYERIDRAILDLAEDPHPRGSRKLRGESAWRIRVGSYRVIYEIDDDVREVLIADVGHRGDIYR